jgi:VIT1/CCC1 family predicted Fe2+/Mn2+ transporter
MQYKMRHHQEEHLKSSDLLTDIVIGMSDGLTVPFALAAGLSSAVGDKVNLIWIAGIAEIAAGSIAMGLGGFLAGQTEQDHYNSELKREYDEVEYLAEDEKEEVREVFRKWKLSKEIQEKATEEISKDKDLWVDFMMN